MLVPEWLTGVATGVIGIGGFALVASLVARARGKGFRAVFRAPVGLLFLGLLCTTAVPFVLLQIEPPACAIVRERDGKMEYASYAIFGAPAVEAHGARVVVDRHAIVNDTRRTLRYVVAEYGYGPASTPEREIPPGGVLWENPAIWHFGPDDPPPDAVQSGPGGQSRGWLTWEKGE